MRTIKSCKPEIVQTWLDNMNVIGGAASIACNVPFLVSERTNRFKVARRWHDRLHDIVVRHSRAVVANSVVGLAYWKKRLGDHRVYDTVENAVPLGEIASVDISRGRATYLYGERRWIGFAGRLIDEAKNIRVLVETWRRLASMFPDAGFVIAGDGPDVDMLGHLKRELGGRLLHFGYVSEHELWAMMRRVAIQMSFSKFEGSPNVVLEAMACGAPLIVSDIKEHREILSPEAASFVPVMDVEGYVRAARRLIEHPDVARYQSAAAAKLITGRSEIACAERYVRVYGAMLENL